MVRFLLAMGIGLPIFGSLAAWFGFKEQDIARASSQTPETISLSKLIARGPEGNANIILTDFVAIKPHVVQRGKRGAYSGTWVPVVPKDAALPGGAPPTVKVFIFSDKVRNPEGTYERLSTPQLPGMVSNKIMTPNNRADDELRELYPQTDFSTCIFIHDGREPASEGKAAAMIYGGIAAAVIGIACLGLALLLWRKNAGKADQKKKKGVYPGVDDDEDRPRKRRYTARDEDEDDERPRKRRRADDDEDDDRPRRKRRASEDDDDFPSRRRRAVARDDDDEDRPRRRSRRDDD